MDLRNKNLRFFLILGLLTSGCGRGYWIKSTFIGSLKRIGATRYDVEPQNIITGSDGSVAIKSNLHLRGRWKGKEIESIPSFILGSEKDVLASRQIGRSTKVSINGADPVEAKKIDIQVVEAHDQGWHIVTPNRTLKATSAEPLPDSIPPNAREYPFDDYFPIHLKGKDRALLIRKINLAGNVKNVPSDKIQPYKSRFFLPALALDIIVLPIKIFVFLFCS